MPVKDYYKILELPSNATLSEIKKNFRRLALRYHPDTNYGNRYADAWFEEIQEAYTVLSDPALREQYLQERWLLKSQGKSFAETAPLTPPFVLRQIKELEEQVKSMDHFRMDHQMLQQQILFVLNDENLEVLRTYDETDLNKDYVLTALDILTPLRFPLIHLPVKQIKKLADTDPDLQRRVDRYFQKRKKTFIWEKYQGVFLLTLTLLICLCIYLLGK